jgi:hypothetical protein
MIEHQRYLSKRRAQTKGLTNHRLSPRITKRISSTSRIKSHHPIRFQNPDLAVYIHARQERWLEDIEHKKVARNDSSTEKTHR